MPTNPLPRCRVEPLPNQELSLQIDSQERLRWHHGAQYPRPFFYPLIGPSGVSVVRMGHPGAPNHDHHRGIWFAHHDVVGNDFWSDRTESRIRQLEWLCYEDGETEARVAMRLGWFDEHDAGALLQQEVIAAIRPAKGNETFVEIQTSFHPVSPRLEFRKSNFGFLGVRVAKRISTFFGGGLISNSDGRQGEAAVFGKPARWVDYSGPAPATASIQHEGITYFDHPSNPEHPSRWHVREDGWMIASACMQSAHITTEQNPLTLRYLLHAHAGHIQRDQADEIAARFRELERFQVVKSDTPHVAYQLQRTTR